MTVFRLLVIATLTVVTLLGTAADAHAQGTVSAPTITNITRTSFDVEGTYTVTPGYVASKAYVIYTPQGGFQHRTTLAISGSKIGRINQMGNVVPETVTNLNYGTTYSVNLEVEYYIPSNPLQKLPIQGTAVNITTLP